MWRESTRSETANTCVEVAYTSACDNITCVEVAFPRCDTGSCVTVSYTSACEQSSCVEVGHAADLVLVRDSKNPDQEPIKIPVWQWRGLLDRIRGEERINWDGVFFPLVFDEAEIEAFVKGALAGEFDLPPAQEVADVG